MKEQVICFSELLPERSPKTYKGLVEVLDRYGVLHRLLKGTQDIWCRDYMPIEIYPGNFVAWGYNPDYLQTEELKKSITDGMSVAQGIGHNLRIHDRHGILVDGGNVIKAYGKMIMTSKVFEENPGWRVNELANILEASMGARLIVIPWDTREIYGHADGMVRIVNENTVVMTNYSQIDPQMAARFHKCLEPHFRYVRELHYEVPKPHKNSWAYINWLQTDKVLILPKFNAPEDEQALRQVSAFVPEYKGRIEMVDATDLIRYEGCLNCASWEVSPFMNGDVLTISSIL